MQFLYIIFVWSMIKYIQGGGLLVHQWDIRAGNMFELAVVRMTMSFGWVQNAASELSNVVQYLFMFSWIQSGLYLPKRPSC